MKLAYLALLCVACGASTVEPTHPHRETRRAELDRFLADETLALDLMAAADPRIAARGITADADTLHHATMSAILAEDASLGMEGNRPDVLSFEVRKRALDMAAKTMGAWPVAPSDPDPASTQRPELDRELLTRMTASEKLRLASEREVPRSASVLLGALAATWRAPELKDVEAHDGWLSRRLGEVTQSITPQSLTALERDELDDALDPLERAVGEGYPKSRAVLVGLRLAVQRVELAPHGHDHWTDVGARLRADVGTLLSADTLLALLSASAKLLRDEIGQLVVKVTDDLAERAGATLVSPVDACHATARGSRLRVLAPPPERAFDCAFRARIIAAHTAAENLEVLVAMHDAVVAATWAVVLARGGDATAIALAAPKRLAYMSPTLEGKLMRFAATHPVEAISRALSTEWIMRSGLADAALRAEAWATFGDAPLDVIERELHPRRQEKNQLRQSGSN